MGQGYFLGDEPMDTSFDLGIAPLSSLETSRDQAPRRAPVPQVEPVSDKSDDASAANREFFARLLLSLGSIGGEKAPQFLTDELRDRARSRRDEEVSNRTIDRQERSARRTEQFKQAGEERKAKGVQGAGQLLMESYNLEAEGDIQGASMKIMEAVKLSPSEGVMKEALAQAKNLQEVRTAKKMARSAEEIYAQLGAKALAEEDRRTLAFQLAAALPGVKMPPKVQEQFVEQAMNGRRYSTQGDMVYTQDSFGKDLEPPRQIPKTHELEPGKQLLQVEGDKVTKLLAGPPAVAGQTLAPETVFPLAPQRAPVQAPLRPTSEQMPLLNRALGDVGDMTWSQIEKRWPRAGEKIEEKRREDKIADETARVVAVSKEKSYLPFKRSGLPGAATHTLVDKKTGMTDATARQVDVEEGRAVALTDKVAREVQDITLAIPRLERMEALAKKLLAKSQGENLFRALELYGKNILGDADTRMFMASVGSEGLKLAVAIDGARTAQSDVAAVLKGFPNETDTVESGTRKMRQMIGDLKMTRDVRLGRLAPAEAGKDPAREAVERFQERARGGKGASGGF